MNRLWRLWRLPLIIVATLLLPVAVLGLAFEDRVQDWVTSQWSAAVRFWIIVAALSSDLFLPIPSSGLSTYAGGSLGVIVGASASWLGLTIGAVVGFALARWLGHPFAVRHSGEDAELLHQFTTEYGIAALLVTRPLPLLAEACVLLTGAAQMPWRRFLWPVLLSNLVISLAYAVFGAHFHQRQQLPLAVIASVLVPLAVAIVARRAWRRPGRQIDPTTHEESAPESVTDPEGNTS